MTHEIFSASSFFWSCLWQSTIFLLAGLLGSFLLRRHSARAHRVLFMAMIAAVIVPAAGILVKHYELGLFIAEPAVILPPSESHVINEGTISNHITERSPAQINHDLQPAITGSNAIKFPWLPALLYAWILASLILAVRLLVTFILGALLLRRATPLDGDKIEQALNQAKTKLGISKQVKIYVRAKICSPVIWCWRRTPVLLVPSAAGQSDIDWTGVLCHELAHYKRHDHVAGLIAELTVCLLPWQPILWLAKSRLINLSELACDDWVIAASQSGTDYAESLLDLIPGSQMAFVPGVTGSKKELANRIRRILKDRCGNPRTGGAWAFIVSVMATCLALGVALAQTRMAEPARESETDRGMEKQAIVTAPEMNGLIRALSSAEWKERRQAATALARLGPCVEPAVAALTNALTDEEWQVRGAAAEALASIGSAAASAVYPLIGTLYDVEWHVRRRAAEALAAIGTASKPATPDLITALNDEEWQVRKPAALALGAIGPAAAEAIPTLIKRLDDPEWQVRYAVTDALEKISVGDKSSVPEIIEVLLDQEWKKRRSAAQALQKSLQEDKL